MVGDEVDFGADESVDDCLTLPLCKSVGEGTVDVPTSRVVAVAAARGSKSTCRVLVEGGHTLPVNLPKEEVCEMVWGPEE